MRMTQSTRSPAATTATEVPSSAETDIEISVVMPCLNEADTLEICIRKAQRAMKEHSIVGEIIVADNGSTDGSIEIAERCEARVVHVSERGYGNALMGGIAAARGKYVLMGDADDSYDFLETPRFVERLREGYQLVQGCRLPSGGGTVLPGAMPFSHRWLGNPMFSWLVRHWFRSPIHDAYCGLRAFTKEFYQRLDLRCTGMEFATKMIIKAAVHRERTAEVPIKLHPDGRKAHAPHLKTFRDGWRTLRMYLLYSPRWLFLVPGAGLMLLGLFAAALALPGATVFGATLDAHTLLFASLFILCGYQAILVAVCAKTFAIGEGLLPLDDKMRRLYDVFRLERGLLAGVSMLLAGTVLLGLAVREWWLADFGALDYALTMRLVIPGATFAALGFQTFLFSFLISLLGLRRK